MNAISIATRLILLLCCAIPGTHILATNCLPPLNIELTEQGYQEVRLKWNDYSTPADVIQYQYVVYPHNQAPDYSKIDSTVNKEVEINQLDPGQSYAFRVRTSCVDGNSNWSAPFIFYTKINTQLPCPIDIRLKDNNCPEQTEVFVLEYPELQGNLGTDLFIQQVNLGIQHDWPADLEIQLQSPSGKTIQLFADRGIGSKNIGNAADYCNQALELNMNACANIDSYIGPLTGQLKPSESFDILYDGSPGAGAWKVIICDDAAGQIGTLKNLSIEFTAQQCRAPEDIFLKQIESTSFQIEIPAAICDSLKLEYTHVATGDVLSVMTDCSGDTVLIENLLPSNEYMLQYSALCAGNIASSSCPKYTTTRCENSSNYEDFDNQELCNEDCAQVCNLSKGIWTNTGERNWFTNRDATPTSFTGPQKDIGGNGQYLYIEASDSCEQKTAILQSSCMYLNATSACNVSFYYHMYGDHIGSLSLEMSIDNGQNWLHIWNKTGEQSNAWKQETISINLLAEQLFQLRFRAEHTTGEFGDIALDEIVLSGISTDSLAQNIWYVDADQDGFGDSDNFINFCSTATPNGYVQTPGDCDDSNPDINPDAEEIPCNLIDENCDGIIVGNDSLDIKLVLQEDQTCINSPNGKLHFEASGGVAPYQFEWSDGMNQAKRDDLSTGYYQVILTDAAGCAIKTDSFFIDINQNFDFLVNLTKPATCLGVYDGSIRIEHDQDNAPFKYLWNTGDTTKDISNITTGTYQLSITDKFDCVIPIAPISVGANQGVDIEIESIQHEQCYQDANGKLVLSKNESIVQYQWSHGDTTRSIHDLSPDTYTVKATDTLGCYAIDSFKIQAATPLDIQLVTKEDISCYGENNGLIKIDIKGSKAPYNIQWNTGDTTELIKGKPAGLYSAKIQDANACQDSITNIVLQEADSIQINLLAVSGDTCTAQLGKIQIEALGGNGTFQYIWSDQQAHSNIADSLGFGTYSVSSIDERGCKATLSNIEVPLVQYTINSIIETMDVQCHGQSNGEIRAVLSNFNAPVTSHFNLLDIPLEDSLLSIAQLSPGNYSLYHQDRYGCLSDTSSIQIKEPDSLYLSLDSIRHITCSDTLAAFIELSPIGGQAPYSFEWNTGAKSNILTTNQAGTYSCELTDILGCTSSLVGIKITAQNAPSLTSTEIIQPLCHNDTNGIIKLGITGGTAPYNIYQDDKLVQDSIGELPAGSYQFTIVDAANCTILSDSIRLNNPPKINISLDSLQDASCDQNNGKIWTSFDGGTGLVQGTWNHMPDSNLKFLNNLSAGIYELTVIDQVGCSDSLKNIEIKNIKHSLNASIQTIKDASCFDSENGLIIASILGDSIVFPLKTYANGVLVSTDTTNEILIKNLGKADYTLRWEDALGCSDSLNNIIINAPPEILYSYEIEQGIICHDDTTGIVRIDASGGQGDFQYLWDNTKSGNPLNNLGPGKYRCAIKDKSGCILFTDSIELVNPPLLSYDLIIVDATDNQNNGAIYLTTTGGVPPYSYSWDPDLPMTTDTIEGLGASEWSLIIQDANGCSLDTSFVVKQITQTLEYKTLALEVYPNPSSSYVTINLEGTRLNQLYIYDAYGRRKRIEQVNNQDKIVLHVGDLPNGNYWIVAQVGEIPYLASIIVLR